MKLAPPDRFPANLCVLPQDLQDAIETDKTLWYMAHQKITTQPREQVLQWLGTLPSDQRADMRRRLNTIHARLKKRHQEAKKQMQKQTSPVLSEVEV